MHNRNRTKAADQNGGREDHKRKLPGRRLRTKLKRMERSKSG